MAIQHKKAVTEDNKIVINRNAFMQLLRGAGYPVPHEGDVKVELTHPKHPYGVIFDDSAEDITVTWTERRITDS